MKKSVLAVMICLISVFLAFGVSSAAEGEAEAPAAAPLAVDLDLSQLSGTVVYAQVYNMTCEPEAYIGKIIRMAGYYSAYEDLERNVVYHACVIPDATACCAQGIEFVWSGEHQWPDDYPEEGTDILVTGRLETYDEDGDLYMHLVDSEVVWESGSEADT